MSATRSIEERKWQAESDARTMAEYQQILSDKPRMQRAVKVAKQQAADLSKRATAMQNVASYGRGGRMSTKGSTKTSRRKK